MMNRRVILFFSAAALSLGGAAVAQQLQPDWDTIEVSARPIKPGVAVVVGFGGNIGVSHGDDGTFIVDDQFAELVPKIQAAIRGLGAGPVKYVVNTHWHFDHAGGNAPLGEAGALIIAQEAVRTRLAGGGVVRGSAMASSPKEGLPVITFDHGITFHLNGDTIDVIHTGGGHTDGDSVVYWRKANVLHTGDMMMNRSGFPFVDVDSGGNVRHLLGSIDQMIAMTDGETVIIPGHGPLATRADLIAWRGMIQTAVDRVTALKQAGQTVGQAKAAKPLAGLANAPGGFIDDDSFVEAIWASLEAHPG